MNVKPAVGFTLPWAGVTHAPGVRRRENLRGASFRDHAMEDPLAREASIKRLRARGTGRARQRSAA